MAQHDDNEDDNNDGNDDNCNDDDDGEETGVNLCTILLSWTSARLGLVEDARLMIIIGL